MSKSNPITKVWRFYVDGFKGLSKSSRTLWLIIFLKLFVMFAILKVFFFPNHTKEQAKANNMTGSEWVQSDLINRAVPMKTTDTLKKEELRINKDY